MVPKTLVLFGQQIQIYNSKLELFELIMYSGIIIMYIICLACGIKLDGLLALCALLMIVFRYLQRNTEYKKLAEFGTWAAGTCMVICVILHFALQYHILLNV